MQSEKQIKEEREQNTLRTIAQNIRHFRTLKNMSQTELGLRSDLTPNYITDIENCKRDIMVSTLSHIAYGLDIKIEELFNDNRKEYLSKTRIDKKQ